MLLVAVAVSVVVAAAAAAAAEEEEEEEEEAAASEAALYELRLSISSQVVQHATSNANDVRFKRTRSKNEQHARRRKKQLREQVSLLDSRLRINLPPLHAVECEPNRPPGLKPKAQRTLCRSNRAAGCLTCREQRSRRVNDGRRPGPESHSVDRGERRE